MRGSGLSQSRSGEEEGSKRVKDNPLHLSVRGEVRKEGRVTMRLQVLFSIAAELTSLLLPAGC